MNIPSYASDPGRYLFDEEVACGLHNAACFFFVSASIREEGLWASAGTISGQFHRLLKPTLCPKTLLLLRAADDLSDRPYFVQFCEAAMDE